MDGLIPQVITAALRTAIRSGVGVTDHCPGIATYRSWSVCWRPKVMLPATVWAAKKFIEKGLPEWKAQSGGNITRQRLPALGTSP